MTDEALTVHTLVDEAELVAIDVMELSAKRNEEGQPRDEVEPTHGLAINGRADDMGFRVRIRTEIDLGVGEVITDLGVAFQMPNVKYSEIPRNVLEHYVNDVAIMILLPYLREEIAELTRRVFGASLTMPVLRRGALNFEISGGSDLLNEPSVNESAGQAQN